MDANLITALAGVLGSVSGASAAIATTWISQKSQAVRERGKWETRKRETLYGDFITEASHLMADAFDHSLDKPETLVKLYANLGRIRLVSSDAVLAAAEACCDRILKLYSEPNRTMAEISTTLHGGEFEEFRHFSDPVVSSFENIPLIESRNRRKPNISTENCSSPETPRSLY